MAKWLCAVCSETFDAPPSAKTVTCSKACSSVHRSRMHPGRRNVWGDTSKARRAAKVSPRSGPFESNVNANIWTVISPAGDQYRVRNLRLWCEQHADLFDGHPWSRAYAGLRQVALWLAGGTKRQVSQWRGWTLRDAPMRAVRRNGH